MSKFNLRYRKFGENALLIDWPAKINKEILSDIIGLESKISSQLSDLRLRWHHGYHSLLISYDVEVVSFSELKQRVQELHQAVPKKDNSLISYRWKLPVCYEAPFGKDIDEVSIKLGITKEELIKIHSSVSYTVYFIGFLPGFLYLGGLPEALHLVRKDTPNMAVPKGSVAIGGKQTGVYPQESPGGWHIIGNCPIPFFKRNGEQPTFAKAGDEIQFIAISSKELQEIMLQIEVGAYQLEKEVINE